MVTLPRKSAVVFRVYIGRTMVAEFDTRDEARMFASLLGAQYDPMLVHIVHWID